MPNPPFFFADADADGIVFAFLRRDDPAVYAWSPIEQEWQRVSSSLEEHTQGWSV